MRWSEDLFGDEQSGVAESGVIDAPLEDDVDDWPEGEQAKGAPDEAPDEPMVVVYVPSERVASGVGPDTKVQLRYLDDGLLVLPVFSSLDQLIAGCGEGQPWVAVPAERVDEFRHMVGAELAVLDPVMSVEESVKPQGEA